MKRLLLCLVLALIGAGFQHGHARAATAFGCPAQLASLDFPEPRVCLETQGWWLQGASATLPPNAAVASTHVHLMIPFPLGERVAIPTSGGFSWPYYAQFHNGQSGTVRQVRGGAWQLSSCCPKDPNYLGVPISSVDQSHVGSIPIASSLLGAWRSATGKRENRFTADTTSPFGKRQYQSGAWNAYLNAPGAPVGFTARGWYEGPGYSNFTFKDSNIGSGVGFRASELASICAPSSVSLTYSLAEGTSLAFLFGPSLQFFIPGL